MKTISSYCLLVLLLITTGCGGKKTAEPIDPAAALEARFKSAEKLSNPTAQAEAYLAIARDELQAQQTIAAHKPLKLASGAVGKVTVPADKGRLAAELAILHAQAKQTAEAQEALGQAQGALARIKNEPLTAVFLQARIAVAQHELGSKQTATATLKATATAADSITDVEAQTKAWLGVASAAQQLGDSAEVPMALSQAREVAAKATSPNVQAELLLALAKTEREVNLAEGAETTFAAALATIEKISEPLGRGYALLEAVSARSAMGDTDKAKALLEQLEKSLETIPDKDQVKQLQAKIKTQCGQLAKSKK